MSISVKYKRALFFLFFFFTFSHRKHPPQQDHRNYHATTDDDEDGIHGNGSMDKDALYRNNKAFMPATLSSQYNYNIDTRRHFLDDRISKTSCRKRSFTLPYHPAIPSTKRL